MKILEPISNLEQNFRKSLVALCANASGEGIKIQPYSSTSWHKFRSLTIQEQEKAYTRFNLFEEICSVSLQNGGTLADSKSLVWYAIKKMNLHPRSDLFTVLDDGDIIEIYDSSFIQVFRNFRFFEISSYSLADIFMYQWPELYQREDKVTQGLAAQGIDIFNGKITETSKVMVGNHVLEEVFGPMKFKMIMEPKYMSPLFDKHHRVVAVVATSAVQILNSLTHVSTDYSQAETHGQSEL